MKSRKLSLAFKYFRRKPQRFIVWFSVLAIIISLVFQGFKISAPQAKAAYDGVVINPIGQPLGTIAIGKTSDDSGGIYKYVNDEYLINKDGFLMQKVLNSTGQFIGYRYYTSASGTDTVPQYQITNAVNITNKNLIISSGTGGVGATVYMESKGSDSASALLLNNLTVENSAQLKPVPADREGYNTVYSRSEDWAMVFYGYLKIPANISNYSIEITDANDSVYIKSVISSGGGFEAIQDSPSTGAANENYIDAFGPHYQLLSPNMFYGKNPDVGSQIVYGSSNFDQYLAVEIFYRQDSDSGTISLRDNSGNIIPFTNFSPPVFEKNSVTQYWEGRQPTPAEFNASAGKMAFAYYTSGYGYFNPSLSFNPNEPSKNNYRSYFSPSLALNNIPGASPNIFGFAYDDHSADGAVGGLNTNPISYSRRSEGADYLRTGLINNSIKSDIRSKLGLAKINLRATSNINVLSGASINATGLGYPGGIRAYEIPYIDSRYSVRFNDNIANGAGLGGGFGDTQRTGKCGGGGAYGGIGRGCEDTIDQVNTSTYNNGYGINNPLSLGSGGGASAAGGDPTAPGGSGGGAITLQASNIIIDNALIESNGGNGYFGGGAVSLQKLNYPGWNSRNYVRTGAGSGGGIKITANNTFININNGRINAFGVTGGANNYSNFNEAAYPSCNIIDIQKGYCNGSSSGGGRVAIYYGTGTDRAADINIGLISVLGGDSDIYEGKIDSSDDNEFLPPSGGMGTIVIQPIANTTATVIRTMDISKKVERCLDPSGLSTSAACQAGQVDANNATAQPGDWMRVSLTVTNNIGVPQTITVTDEYFPIATNVQAITAGGNLTVPGTISWTQGNILAPTTYYYLFQVP